MKVSRIALAGALVALAAAEPAFAQYERPQPPPQIPAQERAQEQDNDRGRNRNRNRNRNQEQAPQEAEGPQVTPAESTALQPLQTAVVARDWAAATAALPAAEAAATSPYARYLVGHFKFRIGEGTQNVPLQQQGVEAMLASGSAPAEAIRPLIGAQVSWAIEAENWAAAEQLLTRYLELEPGNADRLYQLGEVKIRFQKYQEALGLYQRLIEIREANGQTAPEQNYRRALELARELRNAEVTARLSSTLLRAYPSPDNWRQTLTLYRQSLGNDADIAVDLRRLMRVTQSFSRDSDYIEFADRLQRAGLLAEAKAVIDEGISRGTLRSSDQTVSSLSSSLTSRIAEDRASLASSRTQALAGSGRQARIAADNHLGFGEYSHAAELYRAALQKGGEDSNLLNLRLGVALALAGQRAEAETAFRAVTGPRAELANFWLLWLSRPAA